MYMGTAKSIGEYSKIESKNVWVIYNPDYTPHWVNYKPDETPEAWHPKSINLWVNYHNPDNTPMRMLQD